MHIDTFNGVKGNIFAQGQKVAWNVWAGEPEGVDTKEWEGHAEKWLHSITVNHEYPTGDPGVPAYSDGSPVKPTLLLEDQTKILKTFLAKHGDEVAKDAKPGELDAFHLVKNHFFEEKNIFARLRGKK